MHMTNSTPTSKGRSYRGISAAERRAQRHQQFLDAGLEVFGHLGYRAGTVRVLCKQAGLTDRYFYESFKDTEDLLRAVYTHIMDALQQRLLDAAPAWPNDWEGRVEAALSLFIDMMADARVARLSLVEVLGVSANIDAMHMANSQRFGDLIIGLIDQQLPTIKLPQATAVSLGMALAGACAMSATHWYISGYKSPRKSVIEACSVVVLGVLRELSMRANTPQATQAL